MALIPVTIFGSQFTSTEVTFLAGMADLSVAQGDIYYINSSLQAAVLAPGASGTVLASQGAGANPHWIAAAGSGTVTAVSVATANGFSGTVANSTTTPAITIIAGAIVPNTVVASDATTPHIDTTSGSTNTGYFLVNGKTSGSLKITAADATAQAITLTVAAQTVGAATLTIPNMANVSKTVAWLESPSFTTPTLGVASATTINKVTITAPATGSTLTIAEGKTLTVSNTMTFAAGADSQTWTFPSSSDTVVTLGATQTLTAKTLTTPVINGTITGTGQATAATASTIAMRDASANLTANNLIDGFTTTATAGGTTALTITSTGVQVFTGSTTQTVTLPTTSVVAGGQYTIINQSSGAVTVQSSGANTITVLAASTSATFTAVVATPTTSANWNSQYYGSIVTSAKSLSVSNTITLAGTDGTTMTFPGSSATVGGLGIAQTWTGQNKFNNIVDVNNAIAASSSAATVPVTYRLNTVTNDAAGTLTITMTTASAVDGQMTIVRILDHSGVAQTTTWVNTENSTVTAPVTSNGSTTLFQTVGFIYNGATSKWRCIASA